jgi:hypothetical protein
MGARATAPRAAAGIVDRNWQVVESPNWQSLPLVFVVIERPKSAVNADTFASVRLARRDGDAVEEAR